MKILRFQSPVFFIAALAALVLSACASLIGPREVVLPLDKMQAAIERKFPLDQRYLGMFDVRFSSPRLSLQPESRRVVSSIDVRIAPSLLGQARNGSLVMSGVLQLSADRNAVLMTEPRVERFSLEGLDPRVSDKLAELGGSVAQKLLRDLPLYTFRPEDLRHAGMRFVPTEISTRADALVVTFVPAK